MTVPHALLAALAEGERYGYQLRTDLERDLGPAWRIDFGQLYRALRSMVAKGWIEFRTVPGMRGPQRKLYRLTAGGRDELTTWLRKPLTSTAPVRDALPVRRRYASVAPRSRRGEAAQELVAVGSDDLVLDLLARYIADHRRTTHLITRAVGSIAGLLALRDGLADMAGIHLLDVDTGEYNVPFLKHLLPEERIVLVELSRREQGLLLAPGNPKRIRRVKDLARKGIRLINRQRGAGTRLLLFQKLRGAGIDPRGLPGYENEVPTHGAVAAAIAAGQVDVGPGVRAVAEAWGLEFLPIASERYDLAMPVQFFESARARPLLEALHAKTVQRATSNLSGYDTRQLGRVVARVG